MKEYCSIKFGCSVSVIKRLSSSLNSSVVDTFRAEQFFNAALDHDICLFETSTMNRIEEKIFARWLSFLPSEKRNQVTILTKVTLNWKITLDFPISQFFLRNTKRHISQTLKKLTKIDILLFDRVTPELLGSAALWSILDFAKSLGIPHLGVVVNDLVSATVCLVFPDITTVQTYLPDGLKGYKEYVSNVGKTGKSLILTPSRAINTFSLKNKAKQPLVKSFTEMLLKDFKGYIMIDVNSQEDLLDNVRALKEAWRAVK